jgi:hypothetical protein
MDWIDLAQDRDQWRAFVGKFLSNCATGGFSRRAQLHGVRYVTTLRVSALFGVNDMMTNDYGAVGGMKSGRGNRVLGENLTQCHSVHRKSHVT